MFRGISELVARVADLAEAEGASLRRHAGRLGTGLALSFLGVALLLCGFALLMIAAWLGMERAVGAPWSSAATGLLGLVLGATFLRAARRFHE